MLTVQVELGGGHLFFPVLILEAVFWQLKLLTQKEPQNPFFHPCFFPLNFSS